jgi:hypothetical protein
MKGSSGHITVIAVILAEETINSLLKSIFKNNQQ